MKAKTQRLYILSVSLGGLILALGLILYSFNENITFFYTPSDLKLNMPPAAQRIRLGGMVMDGSVQREGTKLSFTVSDMTEQINVEFQGMAPDLFREGQGIVAEGQVVEPNLFKADTLLAKHDENYMPPELANLKGAEK